MSEEIKNEIVEEKVEDNKKKESWIQALKFTLFSISAGLIDAGSYALLLLIFPSLDVEIAQMISVTLSVIWNFTLNRKFTFKDASNVPIAMLKVAIFYIIFIPLSGWWTGVLVNNYGWSEVLVKILTMLINFVSEFFYQKYFVFKKPKEQ